ncbi:MAG: integrase [Sulfolobales archaeon]|nr:integrase [Sulfolobales archaeon]
MGGNVVFYRVRKINNRYYLIKEWYDAERGKKRSMSIGPCDKLEEVRGVGFEPTQAYTIGASARRKGGKSKSFFPIQPSSDDVEKFVESCVDGGTSEETCRQYGRYIMKGLDRNNKWSVLAWKAYLKFIDRIDLWAGLKVKRSGVDLYVPSDDEVVAVLRNACSSSDALCWVYKLLIYSGLRLVEVVKVLTSNNPEWVKVGTFWKYPLNWRRGAKQSFYCYSLEIPPQLSISDKWVSNWAAKNNSINPKYVRKWVATKMLSLGIPEEVVNFIQGRTPISILSRHYLKLTTLADQYYPKYLDYLYKII